MTLNALYHWGTFLSFFQAFMSFRMWRRYSFAIYVKKCRWKERLIDAMLGTFNNQIYISMSFLSSGSAVDATLQNSSHRPMNTSELREKMTFEAWTTQIFHIPNHKARWTGGHMAAAEFWSPRGESLIDASGDFLQNQLNLQSEWRSQNSVLSFSLNPKRFLPQIKQHQYEYVSSLIEFQQQ